MTKDQDEEGGANPAGTQTGEAPGARSPATTTQAGAQGGTQESAQQAAAQTDYAQFAATGRMFTKWFNSLLARTNNPTITLGTKTATVIMLRDDGALAVDVDGPDVKAERQSVALDTAHLDELMPQFRKPGV